MKKKKNAPSVIFKKILKIMLAAIVIAGMGAAFISGKVYQRDIVCTGIEACVEDSLSNKFIKAEDVTGIIGKAYGKVEGRKCREHDLARIEEIIDSQDVVKKSQVFYTRDGMLNVVIEQREPVLRIQSGRLGFYVDREGVFFPLQHNYTANVLVIDGTMPVTYETFKTRSYSSWKQEKWMQGAIELALALKESITWQNRISQVHCTKEDGMILIPKEGEERFVIGEPDNIRRKLVKMEKYYTYIRPEKKDKKYTRVDLRYDGQIICK